MAKKRTRMEELDEIIERNRREESPPFFLVFFTKNN